MSENNSDEASTQIQSTGLASSVIRSLPEIQLIRVGITEGDGHGNNDCAICSSKFHGGGGMVEADTKLCSCLPRLLHRFLVSISLNMPTVQNERFI